MATMKGGVIHQELGFARLLEPGLRKVFFNSYNELEEQYSKIFNVLNSTKAKEHDYTLGTTPIWTEFNQNGAVVGDTADYPTVPYVTIKNGQEITYNHAEYSQGVAIERKMLDDQDYITMQKMTKSCGRGARYLVEQKSADLLNNGFTVNGYDGKPLFSNAHPLIQGGTGSNLATGVLSVDNLKLALTLMAKTVDEGGKKVVIKPKKLIVPRVLEFKAKEILSSTLLADTELNNINSLNGKLEIVVNDFLTSDTAWFVQGDTHELNFFWRTKLEFGQEEEFDNFVYKLRGYCRFSLGYSDWRGVVGSTGVATP